MVRMECEPYHRLAYYRERTTLAGPLLAHDELSTPMQLHVVFVVRKCTVGQGSELNSVLLV
jgi:hypothetical protein